MEGEGSTIAAYIRRFRGPPTSREERSRKDRAQDFWWVDKTTSPDTSRGSVQEQLADLNDEDGNAETNDNDGGDASASVASYEEVSGNRTASDKAMSMDELSATIEPITSNARASPPPSPPPPPPPSTPLPFDDSFAGQSIDSFVQPSGSLAMDNDLHALNKLHEFHPSFWDDFASNRSSSFMDSHVDVPATFSSTNLHVDGLDAQGGGGSMSSSIESTWYSVHPDDVLVEDPEVTIHRLRSRLGLLDAPSYASLPLSQAAHSFRSDHVDPPFQDGLAPLASPFDTTFHLDDVFNQVAAKVAAIDSNFPPTTEPHSAPQPVSHALPIQELIPTPPPTPTAVPLIQDSAVMSPIYGPPPPVALSSPPHEHYTFPAEECHEHVTSCKTPTPAADQVGPLPATSSFLVPNAEESSNPPAWRPSGDVVAPPSALPRGSSDQKPPRRPSVGIAFRPPTSRPDLPVGATHNAVPGQVTGTTPTPNAVPIQVTGTTPTPNAVPGQVTGTTPTPNAVPIQVTGTTPSAEEDVGNVVEGLVASVVLSWVAAAPVVSVPVVNPIDLIDPIDDNDDDDGRDEDMRTNAASPPPDPNDDRIVSVDASMRPEQPRDSAVDPDVPHASVLLEARDWDQHAPFLQEVEDDDDTCKYLDDDVVRMLVHRILLCEEALAILNARQGLQRALAYEG